MKSQSKVKITVIEMKSSTGEQKNALVTAENKNNELHEILEEIR